MKYAAWLSNKLIDNTVNLSSHRLEQGYVLSSSLCNIGFECSFTSENQ